MEKDTHAFVGMESSHPQLLNCQLLTVAGLEKHSQMLVWKLKTLTVVGLHRH